MPVELREGSRADVAYSPCAARGFGSTIESLGTNRTRYPVEALDAAEAVRTLR